MRKMWCVLGLFAVIAVAPAAAAEPALSTAEVRGFAASLGELQALAERHDLPELELDEDQAAARTSPMSAAVAGLRGHPMEREFAAIVRRHGFDGAAHWGRVGDRVFRAYMAVMMERESPGAAAEMQAAMREIEQNPDLPPDQKRMMLEMMGGAMESMRAAMEAPAADKEAVRAHLPEIERAFGEE